MMRRQFAALTTAVLATLSGLTRPAQAGAIAPKTVFPSIEGGEISSDLWAGKPLLLVNTASLCGFTPQLKPLQTLHETYGPRGLVVLAVPSDDFSQELSNAKEVSEFCTLEYGITLPMTDILHVAKGDVHPLYAWLKQTQGFVPRWNFNKVLFDRNGSVAATYGAMTDPLSKDLTDQIEALLAR